MTAPLEQIAGYGVVGALLVVALFALRSLTASIVNNGNLMLGRGGTPDSLVSFSKLFGTLDDIALFDGVLTANDVSRIYNSSGTSVAYL